MNRSIRALGAMLLLAVAAGCANRMQVVDPAGRPLQGVAVEPVSLSVEGTAVLTDAQGNVNVPAQVGLRATKWIAVFKPGFEAQQVTWPVRWPLRLVLQPTPTKPCGG